MDTAMAQRPEQCFPLAGSNAPLPSTRSRSTRPFCHGNLHGILLLLLDFPFVSEMSSRNANSVQLVYQAQSLCPARLAASRGSTR